MLYRSTVADADEHRPLTALVPGCIGEDFCPIEVFKQSIKNFIPDDINRECMIV